MAKPMAEEGYDAAFVAALDRRRRDNRQSWCRRAILAVVYGAIGNVSIAGLFLGGIGLV